MSNAHDADGDDVTYTAASQTGTIVDNNDGTFTYTPNDPTDTLTFRADDRHGGITIKTISIAPNNVPTVDSQTGPTYAEDGTATGSVVADDLDNDALQYGVIQGSKGAAVVQQDGTWTYTASDDARHDAAALSATPQDKEDTFTITVDDGQGGTLNVPITVDISPANTEPTFDVDVSDPDENGAITYTVINQHDAENDTLTYTISQPSHGSLDLVGTSYVYTPDGSYEDDQFTISADDGHGGVTSYTASIVAPEPPEQPSHFDAPGTPLGAITLSPNKTRVYQYSYDAGTDKTYLTIVDADSGDPVREPIELQGNGQAPNSAPDLVPPTTQFTDNGKFALIRTYDPSSDTTYVTVVNNETGEVVDAPIEMAGDGQYFNNGRFQIVGNRAYVETMTLDPQSPSTQLAIINTDTGELVTAEPLSSSGYMVSEQLSTTSDGRVLFATYDPVANATVVSLINSETGVYVGTGNEAVDGRLGANITLDEANSRIFVPTVDDAAGTSAVHFVSTDTGQEFGTPVELDGSFWGQPVSRGGNTYYVTMTDNPDGSSTTWVTAIDGSTGAKSILIDDLNGRPINENNLVVDEKGHVYLTTYVDVVNPPRVDRITTITVVDAQGNPITSVDVVGESRPDVPIALSADGKTVYYAVYNSESDPDDGSYIRSTTTLVTFDTADGTQLNEVELDGYLYQVTPVGDRLIVRTGESTTSNFDPASLLTIISIINTDTGAVLGDPAELKGNAEDANSTPRVMIIRGDRLYVMTQRANHGGSYTTDLAVINLRTGEALDGVKSFTETGEPVSGTVDVKDNGLAYLTVGTLEQNPDDPASSYRTTFYTFDTSDGRAVGTPLTVKGKAIPVYDEEGNATQLVSTVIDSSTDERVETIFTSPDDPDNPYSIGPLAGYIPSADGRSVYVIADTGAPGDEMRTIFGQFDLATHSVIGEPTFIDGQPTGYGVLDDDGDVFVTTTLEDGTTRITRIPGDAPSGMRMMTLGAGPSAPSSINVIYPEPEDTNPLVPEPFSSKTPAPASSI